MRATAREYMQGRLKRAEISKETFRSDSRTLERWADTYGQRPVLNCGRADIDRYLAAIGHVKPATRRLWLGKVTGLLKWCVLHGKMRPKVLDNLPKIKVPRGAVQVTTAEETHRILNSAPDTRLNAIVHAMWWPGLRCVEVARLDVEDVDWHANAVIVTGKGRHERWVPLVPELKAALTRYLAEFPATSGPLIRSFRSPAHGLLPHTISTLVARYLTDIGVKRHAFDGRSAHAGRRTAATDTLEATGNVVMVRDLLGHQNLSSTERYLRRYQVGELREAMAGREYPAA